jgi:hypothetical protein
MRLLEDGDMVTSLVAAYGGCEATDSSSYNDDVEEFQGFLNPGWVILVFDHA